MLPLMLSLLLFGNVLVFASLMLSFGLFGGCTPEEQTPGEYDGYTELLGDPKFQGGINIDASVRPHRCRSRSRRC